MCGALPCCTSFALVETALNPRQVRADKRTFSALFRAVTQQQARQRDAWRAGAAAPQLDTPQDEADLHAKQESRQAGCLLPAGQATYRAYVCDTRALRAVKDLV